MTDFTDRDSSPNTSDAESEASGEYVPGCFEGPEKNLEMLFKRGTGNPRGCRELSRASLDAICATARCTILSGVSNNHLDAYVLSESSLFVYSHKMVLKTCGRTTLLRCLKPLLLLTTELGLELEWIGYSRKNYTFPQEQFFPHSSFQEEFDYLKKHPSLEAKLGGSGHVLGPLTGDHWLVYCHDKEDKATSSRPADECTINIMMFDLDPAVAATFYKANNATAEEMTAKSGIYALVPGATVDDKAFEPCGYSMNAILFDTYATIHITPEQACSYASFETNNPLKSYTALINNVLGVFKPGRVVITLMAESIGLAKITENPFDNAAMVVPTLGRYVRSSSSFTKIEGDCCVTMGNWELKSDSAEDKIDKEAVAHRRANRLGSV
jgi:S-adenosylmethionine decarboxylase